MTAPGPIRSVDRLFTLQAALLDPAMSKGDVSVLACLIELTNVGFGYAWPSVDTLAAVTGLKDRSVQKSIRRLADTGLVQIVEGGGRQRSNKYRVVALVRRERGPIAERLADALAERLADAPKRVNAGSPFQATGPDIETVNASSERVNSSSQKGELEFTRSQFTTSTYQISSANAAPPPRDGAATRGDVGKFLRQVEDDLKANSQTFQSTLEAWRHWEQVYDDLTMIVDATPTDDPVYEWARRLGEEICYRQDELRGDTSEIPF